ncbi:MAG: hypothetical protein H6722_05220 [Sandaracinus sp.]|nr:hypothetical protein [Sandaracinus sp.]MCB9624547.1 hypothetical protein [Sandaracinus sp.]
MNRRSALAFATLALVGATACLAVGCHDDGAAAWLEATRQAHASADAANDPRVAERVLLEAFEREVPNGVAAEDARIVRQDLAYRMASLALDDDRAEDARRFADRGLQLGTATDVFTANLYVARGQAREVLGDAVGAAGDYHEALIVNEALLDRVLGDSTPSEDER